MHELNIAKMTKVHDELTDLQSNSRRHVNELDALTTVQDMARKAYHQQEGTKFKLDMARTIA